MDMFVLTSKGLKMDGKCVTHLEIYTVEFRSSALFPRSTVLKDAPHVKAEIESSG